MALAVHTRAGGCSWRMTGSGKSDNLDGDTGTEL